jgi:hypothetical protein
MGYKSRRKYTSRREKFQGTMRTTRLVILFIIIATAIWIFKNRYEYWAWLKTYFY